MDIVYKDQTLFVDMFDDVDSNNMMNLRKKVYKIMDEYDISSLVLNFMGKSDPKVINSFVTDYKIRYTNKITIK